MRVHSFTRQGRELVPVEIDLTLAPGLPQIILLGLPDAGVRESAVRIRSALRKQGFKWPKTKRVIVQLRPHDRRKSSEGLDLAIAAALLWETKQIPECQGAPCLYGVLSLGGAVETPSDILEIESDREIWTGGSSQALPFPSRQLRELKEMKGFSSVITAVENPQGFERPLTLAAHFPAELANLGAAIAAGEHSCLLAGEAGSGKSTLAASIPAWLEAPQGERGERAARKFARENSSACWRPVVRPHHSITPLSMIGGGAALWPGEIHRADSGVLILDELAEFHSQVHEALREPSESGTIQLARIGQQKTYSTRFCLIATTNLCDCGRYVPGQDETRCRCRSAGRRRILAKLSGPMLDRFQILALTTTQRSSLDRSATVPAEVIALQVAHAIEFRRNTRGQQIPNATAPDLPSAVEVSLTALQSSMFSEEVKFASRRRHDSVLRLARTCADLRASESVSNEDLNRAIRWGLSGHAQL